ncbi:MAG: 2-hydroxychromene-2-carboxylate isomerase [Gammaproteobacteria bacterium]|jgi:2-hydroxychromene-2-carboxylate isomerase|nr:2-hydroxychromene-2-carboxylate isomerase [Gammaproteobacteria bacterium]|tara:strand:+ start:37 stop:630 length:594 start_codon:yes stop_codon:yes gene_type:complete
MQVEYFFDCSSPWTYLAYSRIETICAQRSAELIWKPILVGGVFNSVNTSVYEQRANPIPVKANYYAKDLQDWARHQGITIGSPPIFPVNSVKAMRGCFVAMEKGLISEYVGHVFRAYWTQLKDISKDEVLQEVLDRTGLEQTEFFQKITIQLYKDKLRANTEELIHRGGFGSPTMFLNQSDMFFGNDRLTLLEARLG